jgi:cephalosporin hydroxylase
VRLILDTDARTLVTEGDGERHLVDLYSDKAFELLSLHWLQVGWNQKYTYTFSWLGRPVIQLPEDLIRIQEVVWRVRPDVIVETGVAHGGSLVFSASLCRLLGSGRVIGVDIGIRSDNRKAIEAHPLSSFITLVEGDSVASETVAAVKALAAPGQTVLVLLDSCHTKDHVLKELEAYHDLVTPGSYIVATDGIMKHLAGVPRGRPEWRWDQPVNAVEEFLARHPEFVQEQPSWPFNESNLRLNVTHWMGGWLRRLSA